MKLSHSVLIFLVPLLFVSNVVRVYADAQPRSGSDPILEFKDEQTKVRYHDLLEELRCLVCQNQSLADSGAGLAQDLRREVYEQVENGASDDDVIDFMVARYGDFVLYDPPLKASTIILWVSPFLLALIALGMLLNFLIQRNRQTNAVDEQKIRKAASLLSGESSNSVDGKI